MRRIWAPKYKEYVQNASLNMCNRFTVIFCDDRLIWIFWKPYILTLILVKNWPVSHFLHRLFAFHNSSSAGIEGPFFALVFISYIYFFLKCRFHVHYNVYRTRNLFQNYSIFSQISIAKNVNTSFVNITFCCFSSSEAILQGLSKNKPTGKQIDTEIKMTIKYAAWRRTWGENVLEAIATNYKTKLQINVICIRMCFS